MDGFMRTSTRQRALTICAALSVALVAFAGCSSGSPTTTITDGQVPAPGSQEGVHSVADTDYEQIALAVDTQQIALDGIAAEPARKASEAVKSIAKSSAETVGPEAKVLRAKLVKDGNATTVDHHKPAVSDQQLAAIKKLSGERFNSAWARAMYSLNQQVIAAAATEMDTGEDQTTRAMARAKIDYASAQNGALQPIMTKQ